MKESGQLLKAYAEHGDELAFREIVERYSRLVYSTALRQVGDSHAAQDITQLVFTHLARKAGALPRKVVIGGWLFRDTVFTASKYRRSMARRRVREEVAARMSNVENEDAAWMQVAPLIEDAMTRLGVRDRDVIVLRFFEEQPFRSVGSALGISEDAARMRVERALEKLRRFFVSRGVAISATGLATMLANNALGSVPGDMMTSIAANALHNASVAGGFQISLPDWIASKVFKFGMASVLSIGLVSGFIWHSHSRARPSVSAIVPQSETRFIQIQGGVRRTTRNPTAMSFYMFGALAIRPGEQAFVTNIKSNYRLIVSPTIEADKIRIESSLVENASNPASRTISFPTVIATNGEKSVASNGIYSFEFSPTFAPPPK
jgi:RNA polymerase sigma factor (sigma-70 family)